MAARLAARLRRPMMSVTSSSDRSPVASSASRAALSKGCCILCSGWIKPLCELRNYRLSCGTPACALFKAKNLVLGSLLKTRATRRRRRTPRRSQQGAGETAVSGVLVRTRPRPRARGASKTLLALLAARPPALAGSKERSGARPGGHSNANLQSARGGSNCLPRSQRHGREMLGIIPARGGSATHGHGLRALLQLQRRPRGRGHGDGDDRWHQPDARVFADRHGDCLRGRCGFGSGQFVRRPHSLRHGVRRRRWWPLVR